MNKTDTETSATIKNKLKDNTVRINHQAHLQK